MSLARNPNMAYAAAGKQMQQYERMHVHSHVRVPDGEASADYDGRRSYSAPADAGRRAVFQGIPFYRAMMLLGVTAFILGILFLGQVSQRANLAKQRQAILDDMQSTRRAITELNVQVAQAQDSSAICYQAVQNLGMVTSKGVETIEIYAPDTRPTAAGLSLPAMGSIAMGN